ncbi:MAG: hypothetical protein RR854_00450 [Muribaculaceae bacterium]
MSEKYKTKSPVLARLVDYIEYIGMSVNAFEVEWGVSKNYIRNTKRYIKPDYLDSLIKKHPNIDLNWLVAGRGSMPLSEEKENLSENKSNLTKQNKDEARNGSMEELITNKVNQAIMEQISSIIESVGKVMEKQLSVSMQKQNDVINSQLEIIRDIVVKLAEIGSKTDDIKGRVLSIDKKVSNG